MARGQISTLDFLKFHVVVVDIPKTCEASDHRKQTAHDHEQWSRLKSVVQHQTDTKKYANTHCDFCASAERVVR